MTIDNEVLYEKYNIDIELYRGMPIDFEVLRIRTANCLKGAGIFEIDSLLAMSYDKLSMIKNLGMLSLNDIEDRKDAAPLIVSDVSNASAPARSI